MNRFLLALVVVCAASTVWAQDDRLDEITFDEVQLADESSPYFAVGVGFTANIMTPDLAGVNGHAGHFGLPAMSGPMIVTGADIFTAIAVVPNVRAGFYWLGGGLETSVSVPNTTPSITRTMAYNFVMRGVYLDYAFVPTKGLAILPGVAAGWGSQTMEIYQGAANRAWGEYMGPNDLLPSGDGYQHLDRSTLHIAPRLNVEYALTPFLNIRAAASYQMQVSAADWMASKTSVVTGVSDGINMNAFSASIGVFVGLFN
jgi:hypothetical protein